MNALTLTAKRVDGNPRISFDEAGSGPPLVFLHGIGGNRTNWREQQSAMSDLCTTISWDARGYGRSEDYEGPLEFRLFGEDLARLLDARGIEKAHLVGLSMGARILLDFFSFASNRVATLTLCDCFYSFGSALSSDKQAEFIALRQEPLLKGKTLADLAPNLIHSLVGPNCSEDIKNEIFESITALHVDSYLKTIAASTTFDVINQLKDINVPVQLMFGEYDRLTPPAIGEKMMLEIPDAHMDVIENSGHLCNMEQPVAFNTVLRKFLESNLTLASFKS
jgi:3-oxoadipate enol-lactonase